MKYTLIGVKTCPITQNIQATIEHKFNSYTEARMHQIVMEREHLDMKFHINFNTDFVSIETMLCITDKSLSHIPSNYN